MNETMTAKKLYEIVEPVWKCWPVTKPESLIYTGGGVDVFSLASPDGPWMIYEEDAIALCEIAMVKALAEVDIVTIFQGVRNGWYSVEVEIGVDRKMFEAPTLIEALAAACLKVKGL